MLVDEIIYQSPFCHQISHGQLSLTTISSPYEVTRPIGSAYQLSLAAIVIKYPLVLAAVVMAPPSSIIKTKRKPALPSVHKLCQTNCCHIWPAIVHLNASVHNTESINNEWTDEAGSTCCSLLASTAPCLRSP